LEQSGKGLGLSVSWFPIRCGWKSLLWARHFTSQATAGT
jgi:hypothetical protein